MKVAVIGAGIGGLAAVRALRQRGIEADVYENAPELGEVGAGLKLGPNGVKVLRALGFGEALARYTYSPSARITLNWDDSALRSRHELLDTFEARYGAPYVTAYRPDLHRMLLESVPADAVHLGRRCVDVRTGQVHATAIFDDGAEVTADYVIGADGIRSIVRAALLGEEPLLFTKSVAYRCLIDAKRVPDRVGPGGMVPISPEDHTLWYGPGGQVLFYPIGDGSTINVYAGRTCEEWTATASSVPSSAEELLEEFAGWNGAMLAMLSEAEDVVKWGIFDRDPVPSWSKGRVTLLGDAAHPTMPNLAQGANMAIEDAYVLAKYLALHADQPAVALAEYERRRRERTARITLESRENFLRSMEIPPKAPKNRDWIFDHDATIA